MNAPFRPPKPHYAGKVAVRRALAMAQDVFDVGGLELGPDGTIRLYDRQTAEAIATRDLKKG